MMIEAICFFKLALHLCSFVVKKNVSAITLLAVCSKKLYAFVP